MKMKRLKILLLILFVSGISWFLTKSPDLPNEECANEFITAFYNDYHSQLKNFINTYPDIQQICNSSNTIHRLVLNINQPLENAVHRRKVHENFVDEWRLLIQSPHKENLDFIRALTNWIYLKPDMKQATIDYFAPFKSDPVNLMRVFKALRQNKAFSRAPHETTHVIDQYRNGNLPSLLFTLNNDSQTRVLRMGYPLDTINRKHLPWITPEAYPEFLFFLQNQTGHLYVNLMKRNGTESSASKALEKLEKKLPGFFIVTLDKNSNFYWQSKNQSVDLLADDFKNQFFNHLTNFNGDFYWSKHLEQDKWGHQLKRIMENVHAQYFPDKDSLNAQERQDFIELSYLKILDALVEQLQPASMNITCRQCMDRGPSLYVLWMLEKNAITSSEIPDLLLAPPLLIHNRPSHPSRVTRFISAAQRI